MFRPATFLAALVAFAPACVGGSAEPSTDLTVLYQREPHVSVLDRVTLTCDPAGGNLPDPAAACRRLHADPDRYVGQVTDVACMGPVTRWSVTISGHLEGRKVSRPLMRFEVTFYRDGLAAATVAVDASSEEDAVKTALSGGQVAGGVLDGPWTATVDPIRSTATGGGQAENPHA